MSSKTKLSEPQKHVADKAFIKCDGEHDECVYAAVEAVLAMDERQSIDKQFEGIGEFYKDAQHDGDVVERMCDALWNIVNIYGCWSKTTEDRRAPVRNGMTAALAEARRGMVALDAVEKAIQEELLSLYGGGTSYSYAVTKQVLARLAPERKEPSNKKQKENHSETEIDVRMVRPVGGSLLGQEQSRLVPLPITDDRPPCPVDVDTPLIALEPPREEGKHRFLGGTCVDCGHPLDEICTANLQLAPRKEQSKQEPTVEEETEAEHKRLRAEKEKQ